MRGSSVVERLTHNQQVAGSIPAPATNINLAINREERENTVVEKNKASAAKAKGEIQSLFRDVVDPEADPGERWVMQKVPVKSKTGEILDEVEVALVLRRMPREVTKEYEALYMTKRDMKDNFGNKRVTHEWELPKLDQFGTARALWMWIDCENMMMEIGDQQAAILIADAVEENNEARPDLKVGASFKIDGYLTDSLKAHYLSRFPALKKFILECAQRYDEMEDKYEDRLRKN